MPSSRFSETFYLKNKLEGSRGRHPTLGSALHIQAHMCIHTWMWSHTHTAINLRENQDFSKKILCLQINAGLLSLFLAPFFFILKILYFFSNPLFYIPGNMEGRPIFFTLHWGMDHMISSEQWSVGDKMVSSFSAVRWIRRAVCQGKGYMDFWVTLEGVPPEKSPSKSIDSGISERVNLSVHY